ncbi:MAG: FlgO family outer membrane protein [Candidatus Sumerlaeota bacterium]
MRKASVLIVILLLSTLLAGCSQVSWLRFNTPPRVAVVDFQNLTGDPENDRLGAAIGEYMTTYLTNRGLLLLRDRQDISRRLQIIDAGASEREKFQRWQQLGKQIGARYLIGGSISRLDGNYVIDARIFDVDRGLVINNTAIEQTCLHEYEIYDRVQYIAEFESRKLMELGAMQSDSQQ